MRHVRTRTGTRAVLAGLAVGWTLALGIGFALEARSAWMRIHASGCHGKNIAHFGAINGGPVASAGTLQPSSTTAAAELLCPIPDNSVTPKSSFSTINVHLELRSCKVSTMVLACAKDFFTDDGSCGPVASRTFMGNQPIEVDAQLWQKDYLAGHFPYVYMRLPPIGSGSCTAGDGKSRLFGMFVY